MSEPVLARSRDVMVVVQHEQLHNVLWGPPSRDGRSKRADVIVYVQLALVAALGVRQVFEYDKPVAARLAACGGAFLLYFRSVGLFLRLIMLLSLMIAYGDILMPMRVLIASGDGFSKQHIPALVYAMLLVNNAKLAYFAVRAMPSRSSKKIAMPKRAIARKPKAA